MNVVALKKQCASVECFVQIEIMQRKDVTTGKILPSILLSIWMLTIEIRWC